MVGESGERISGVLNNIGRNLTIVGSIVAAIVGMNTALTTCSTQTIARHQTFRQATDAEEQYWRGLYADYLSSFSKNLESDEREARLFALRVLAERQIPSFEEYSLGWFDNEGPKIVARERLTSMRSRLQEALSRKESSTPAVALKQQDQTFESAVQDRLRTKLDRQADQAMSQPQAIDDVAPDAGVSYQTQILALGDPKGWDLDIFWCGGGDTATEGDNYRRALLAARRLAELSTNKSLLAGEKVGRVRIVMLPEQRQGGDYPSRGFGNEIRSDRGDVELRIATHIQQKILGAGSYRMRINDPPPSQYYLSLFSCGSGQAPEGRPPPRAPKGPQPVIASKN